MRMVVSEDKGSKGYVFFSFRKDSCISFDVLVIFSLFGVAVSQMVGFCCYLLLAASFLFWGVGVD